MQCSITRPWLVVAVFGTVFLPVPNRKESNTTGGKGFQEGRCHSRNPVRTAGIDKRFLVLQ